MAHEVFALITVVLFILALVKFGVGADLAAILWTPLGPTSVVRTKGKTPLEDVLLRMQPGGLSLTSEKAFMKWMCANA
ncbi:hypothetical protein [Actinokineospora fastidiosa]|uniref:hypothetical protein n=1 Tax=Actinokineospora fastidiosa TaxID=1816 RepID=UPI001670E2B5|nr:hypothetical protein [Actinokineospora fastidiosa]